MQTDTQHAIKLSPLADSLMLSLMLFFKGVFIEISYPAVWVWLLDTQQEHLSKSEPIASHLFIFACLSIFL